MKLQELIIEGIQTLGQTSDEVRNSLFTWTFTNSKNVHSTIPHSKIKLSPLTAEEIEIIEKANLIQEVATSHPTTVRAFLVTEERKGKCRRRTIFHTIEDNNNSPRASNNIMKVASINLLSSRVRTASYAASRDFKSYYHQLEWGPQLRNTFVFETNENQTIRKFALNRVAMGHKNAAAAATAVTMLLVKIAIKRALTPNVKFDVIIDDVLFLAKSKEELENVTAAFDALCDEFRITVGTKVNCTKQIIHRGIQFNLTSKSQRLKEDFVNKFKLRQEIFNDKPTKSRAESLLGMLAHAAQVIFISNIADAFSSFSKIQSSNDYSTFQNTMRQAANEISNNEEKALESAEETPFGGYAVADATPTTLAASFTNAFGETISKTDRFEAQAIHIAEAMGTIEAVKMIPAFKSPHRISIISDNLTWIHASNYKKTTTPQLATIRNQLWEMIKSKNILPTFLFVPSKFNVMDADSRGTVQTTTLSATVENAVKIR